MTAEKQMGWVYANSIIAFVKDADAVVGAVVDGDRTRVKFITNAMGGAFELPQYN